MNLNSTARGSPRDIPFILVIVFTIALSSVVVYGGTSEAHKAFQDLNNTHNESELPGISRSTDFMGNVLSVFNIIDAGSIILIGVFFLGSTYSALQVNASKIFAIPSFLFLMASLYLAGLLGDAYFTVAETGRLTGWFNFFGAQAAVFDNLGIITGVLGAVLFIATYIKTSKVTEIGL